MHARYCRGDINAENETPVQAIGLGDTAQKMKESALVKTPKRRAKPAVTPNASPMRVSERTKDNKVNYKEETFIPGLGRGRCAAHMPATIGGCAA